MTLKIEDYPQYNAIVQDSDGSWSGYTGTKKEKIQLISFGGRPVTWGVPNEDNPKNAEDLFVPLDVFTGPKGWKTSLQFHSIPRPKAVRDSIDRYVQRSEDILGELDNLDDNWDIEIRRVSEGIEVLQQYTAVPKRLVDRLHYLESSKEATNKKKDSLSAQLDEVQKQIKERFNLLKASKAYYDETGL